jgi:hypothetical protein
VRAQETLVNVEHRPPEAVLGRSSETRRQATDVRAVGRDLHAYRCLGVAEVCVGMRPGSQR